MKGVSESVSSAKTIGRTTKVRKNDNCAQNQPNINNQGYFVSFDGSGKQQSVNNHVHRIDACENCANA